MSDLNIKSLIEQGIPDATVSLNGEGCNFNAIVISDEFEGKSLLQQQRMVYATLGDLIADGTVHALSIKSYTNAQWQALEDKPAL